MEVTMYASDVTVIGWQPLTISVKIQYLLVKVENNGSETPVCFSEDKRCVEQEMAKMRRQNSNVHYRLLKQLTQVLLDSHL